MIYAARSTTTWVLVALVRCRTGAFHGRLLEMRGGFVHEATIELAAGADPRAPGAAVTVALCGSWDHEGGCVIPHCIAVDDRAAQALRVRVVFACVPHDEADVRRQIVSALAAGTLVGPHGASEWRLVGHRPDRLRADEEARSNRWLAP